MRLTDNIMGAALMTGCVLAYVVNDAMMKLVFAEMALFQAVFLRGLMTIPLLCLMVWRQYAQSAGCIARGPHINPRLWGGPLYTRSCKNRQR